MCSLETNGGLRKGRDKNYLKILSTHMCLFITGRCLTGRVSETTLKFQSHLPELTSSEMYTHQMSV